MDARSGPDDMSCHGLTSAIWETMSIEELMDVPVDTVYGASKRVQTLTEAPASVTVVAAEEICR